MSFAQLKLLWLTRAYIYTSAISYLDLNEKQQQQNETLNLVNKISRAQHIRHSHQYK